MTDRGVHVVLVFNLIFEFFWFYSSIIPCAFHLLPNFVVHHYHISKIEFLSWQQEQAFIGLKTTKKLLQNKKIDLVGLAKFLLNKLLFLEFLY